MNDRSRPHGGGEQKERQICGYQDLSRFLTESGFPLSKTKLSKLCMAGEGPPIAGSWGNSHTYLPSEVLKWAQERSNRPRTKRPRPVGAPGRRKTSALVGGVMLSLVQTVTPAAAANPASSLIEIIDDGELIPADLI